MQEVRRLSGTGIVGRDGGAIPPNATPVFEVEPLGVNLTATGTPPTRTDSQLSHFHRFSTRSAWSDSVVLISLTYLTILSEVWVQRIDGISTGCRRTSML